MYSTHAILVNIPYAADAAGKQLSKMTKEEIKEMVINYATEETECFAGPVFDCRSLLDDESVLFANENWDAFEEILIAIDRDQKNSAKHLLKYLEDQAGSTDVSTLLNSLLLKNDRTADRDDVDPDTWNWDYLNQGAWALRQVSRLIHGDYIPDSEFYDTSRNTALVPFIGNLKENPDEWALVQYEYHC